MADTAKRPLRPPLRTPGSRQRHKGTVARRRLLPATGRGGNYGRTHRQRDREGDSPLPKHATALTPTCTRGASIL